MPQPAHRDVLPISEKVDLYDYSSLPASVIVGLQDNSFIYGYGWNRQVALEGEKEKIAFGERDVVIFRGDFIHGGGDYTTTNVRVHVFSDPSNTPQKKLRKSISITLVRVIPKKIPTEESKERECIVRGCGQVFKSGAGMRRHTRAQHKFRFIKYPKHIKQPPRLTPTKAKKAPKKDRTKICGESRKKSKVWTSTRRKQQLLRVRGAKPTPQQAASRNGTDRSRSAVDQRVAHPKK
jgi:hypothetical protein